MIDESAHKVFDYGMEDWHDFSTHKCSHCSRQLDIYYCESRLYLVRCKHCKIVSLVEAGNPNEAAEKVSHCAQQPNEPLTIDELRQMDGEPVYIIEGDKQGYAIVNWSGASSLKHMYFSRTGTAEGMTAEPVFESRYAETWLAYAHKPEGSET